MTDALVKDAPTRFRESFANAVAVGVLLSAAAHFALFLYAPEFRVAELPRFVEKMESIALPPEVTIPTPPEQVPRPASPLIAELPLSEDVTIAPTTFEANPVEATPLPPPVTASAPWDRPSFIPHDTPPRLLNRREVEALLVRFYPSELKSVGIGGSVLLWLYVDEGGVLVRTTVNESSGSAVLDEAAAKVASQMRFSPALNRDVAVGVWVAQRLTFQVK